MIDPTCIMFHKIVLVLSDVPVEVIASENAVHLIEEQFKDFNSISEHVRHEAGVSFIEYGKQKKYVRNSGVARMYDVSVEDFPKEDLFHPLVEAYYSDEH